MGRGEQVDEHGGGTGTHQCPECGAPRAADNTPSCGCGRRASDALREARTAQAAAAEDFDPLRIRPYVELEATRTAAAGEPALDERVPPGATTEATAPPGATAEETAPPGTTAALGATAEETMPLGAVAAEQTMPLRAVAQDRTTALPTPLAPPSTAPSDTDLSLFDAAEATPHDEDTGQRPRRRRRTVLLAAAGAVVVVAASAGLAGGLFSYEPPSRDGAAPGGVRAAVPDTVTVTTEPEPSPSRTGSPSAEPSSASPSPSRTSASPSPTPSSSPSTTEPSPSPTPTSGATATAATPGSGSFAPGGDQNTDAPTLRRGDRGPEVRELQLRLRQLQLYTGEANGNFNGQLEAALRNYQWARGLAADGWGIYGPQTRTQLESETTEP
ncbi:peptidoglycan-binding protein [Streptomyces sp. Ru71]|uniref:peptidoglycan-binding domain-containing protein n=1 Tax=Streptomyces sp. Ru71 TaxID=2080746 RepID=UPI000CDCE87F|nr:peptidoglycan-binding domain-containing protein [Streptomyces sp. Ru71]POX53722.1 peptidoglycan-binding protein [Streptomyces sp. Ru71]